MKDSLILQDKIYISARRVHELFGYTSDYVGQLCRAGKLDAQMIARSWFVTEKSVLDHQATVNEVLKNKSLKKKARNNSAQKASVVSNSIPQEVAPVAPVSAAVLEHALPAYISEEVLPGNVEIDIPFIPLVTVTELAKAPEVVSTVLETIEIAPVAPVEESVIAESFVVPFVTEETFVNSSSPTLEKLNSFSTKTFLKISFASLVLVIAFVFVFQSSLFTGSSHLSSGVADSSTASILSSTQVVGNKIIAFFSGVSDFAFNSFKNNSTKDKKDVLVRNDQTVESNTIPYNGMAVVPSSNSYVKDELIKQKIRESFSDDVVVKPDGTGSSGVITPVFKKTNGDDFLYVLVPVNH